MAERSPRNGLTWTQSFHFLLCSIWTNKAGDLTEHRGEGERGVVVVMGGRLPWLESNQRGGVGEGEYKQTTWQWKACRLLCWKRQTETSPHIDAAVSPQQQFWEMAAVCTVATIYMGLIQPAYRFHHQLRCLVWPSCFTPPIDSLLASFAVCVVAHKALSHMNESIFRK